MSRLTVERISINGFGPARNATVDLTDADGKVIAVTGPNGSGKSTLLETGIVGAMYRKTSRGGLAKSAEVKGSTIETLFRNSVPIITRHSVDATLASPRQEAVLVVGDESPTSGKVKDFSRAAETIFPSEKLLLASSFSMQGGVGNFGELSKDERREALAELLGLSRYQQYHEYAREKRKAIEQEVIRLEARLSDLRAGDIGTIGTHLGDAERQRKVETEKLADIRIELEAAREKQARAKADLEAVEERIQTWQERFARVERLRREHQEAAQALNRSRVAKRQVADLALRLTEVERITGELKELAPEIAKATTERERVLEEGKGKGQLIKRMEQDIARYSEVLGRADEIRAAEERVGDLSGTLSDAEEEAREADRECEANRARVESHRKAQAEVDRLEEKVRDAERGCSHLDQVPFGDRCLESECPFIAEAMGVDMGSLQRDLAAARGRLDPSAEADLSSSLARLKAARDRAHAVSRDLEAARASASDLPLLREAESRSEDLRGQLRKLQDERQGLREDYRFHSDRATKLEERKTGLTKELAQHAPEGEQRLRDAKATAESDAARLDEYEQKAAQLAEQLSEAETSVGEKPDRVDYMARVSDAADKVHAFTGLEREYQERVANLDRAIATYEAELKQAQEAEEKGRDLRRKLEREHQLVARWKLVEKAYGKDGLQALLIDAAGPRITELCNDILDVVLARFRVKLTTTKVSSDGKKILEDLDLRVFDGLRGAERSITDLSGGEGVIVTLALRLAIVLAGGAGSATDFLVLDEMDGALDEQNAQAFVPMLRRAMELGMLRFILFVSHRRECMEAADAVIRLQPQVDGTSTVTMGVAS